MVEKLERCPFCREPAKLDQIDIAFLVECQGCDASSGAFNSPEQAIAAWNRRDPNAITLDPEDEGLVELAARAIAQSVIDISGPGQSYDEIDAEERDHVHAVARAVIAEIMKGRGG